MNKKSLSIVNMKRAAIIPFLLTAVLLSGCSTGSETQSDNISGGSIPEYSVQYNYVLCSGDIAYKNAEELVKGSDIVMLGRVKDISFQMLDSTTGLPPTEESEERHIELCTMYSVEKVSAYKGDVSDIVNIRVRGVAKNDKYLEQQIRALGDRVSIGITIAKDIPEPEIGGLYLFSLAVFEGTDPCLIGSQQQAVIKLNSINDALVKDEYGYISGKDIISYFGEEKWEAFESGSYIET